MRVPSLATLLSFGGPTPASDAAAPVAPAPPAGAGYAPPESPQPTTSRWSRQSRYVVRDAAEEPPLRLCDVLEEEFLSLHPESPLRWPFQPEHIADAPALARRLSAVLDASGTPNANARHDAPASWLARRLGAEARALLLASAKDQPAEEQLHSLRLHVARDLNDLLRDPAAPTELPRESLPKGERATQLSELLTRRGLTWSPTECEMLNRVFLEAAFPHELASLGSEAEREVAAMRRMLRADHAALCLSGGGIRSATFALGVVQSLARADLLQRFSYLSTVSGGGYLGSWLSAWIKHASYPAVLAQLRRPNRARKIDPEPDPIQFLRTYSNFLSPRIGLFSVDMWTLAATYLRNLLLIWAVLLPVLCAAVLAPRFAASVIQFDPADWNIAAGVARSFPWLAGIPVPPSLVPPLVLAVIGFIAGTIAVAYTHRYRPHWRSPKQVRGATPAERGRRAFLLWCLLPLALSTMLLTTAWWWWTHWSCIRSPEWWPGSSRCLNAADLRAPSGLRAFFKFSIFGMALHTVGWIIAEVWRARDGVGHDEGGEPTPRLLHWARELAAVVASGAVIGAIAAALDRGLRLLPTERFAAEEWYVSLALPSFLTLIVLSGFAYIGLMSRHAEEPAREWSARFSAWVLLTALLWFAASALILAGPPLLLEQGEKVRGLLVGIGGLSGLTAILLGRSAATPALRTAQADKSDAPAAAKRPKLASLRGLSLALAAPLAVGFVIVLLSLLDALLLRAVCAAGVGLCGAADAGEQSLRVAARAAPWWIVGATMLVLGGMGVALGWRIDTNKFSLHGMYRSRLIRAFLGASRKERHPDPFTQFDEEDNFPIHKLWKDTVPPRRPDTSVPRPPTPPLHVVNVALNIVRGARSLAWQERKAESFTISPLHAGAFRIPHGGYRRTKLRVDQENLPKERRPYYAGTEGITLGTAVTISGAAASPNMGYHSSPAVTFLMTLFNARLGWWLGNSGPAGRDTFRLPNPRTAIKPMFYEMFGLTTDSAPYIYLSDGGHFENLGLYEMVLRRCRLVIVSDATADPKCALADLANAIRKIRVDLGVPIEFDADEFRIFSRYQPLGGLPPKYWAKGVIKYSEVDDGRRVPDGTIIYLKPSFYGGEPRDVVNYARVSETFPHETTADQFFGESQFESYRALGAFIAAKAIEELALETSCPRREWLAEEYVRS